MELYQKLIKGAAMNTINEFSMTVDAKSINESIDRIKRSPSLGAITEKPRSPRQERYENTSATKNSFRITTEYIRIVAVYFQVYSAESNECN